MDCLIVEKFFLQVYEDEKLIVIYSKSTDHSACPRKHKNFRVADYWSVLTIKPFQEFDKLGIEFSLTAFENPGKIILIVFWEANERLKGKCNVLTP